ncbi:type II toxin-antitoxin system VapC family toxin [Vreelandella massiliensis]|uniref:type II toxin-antitoxin system VapC family toxin n=1 Tax=Vreelandella massiliensis TaxID=1816686 RepID=UPI00096A5AF1|nr:type II toxin-antitoxin system VapC family toxin [Halomonas massiliensis]MYL24832.1 PIN domain-containing protein [Halomonas alkaliantarctica]
MNGSYLLDTNAIIYALNRKLTLPANGYAISVITEMELLSWPSLTREDEVKLRKLIEQLTVIQLETSIQSKAIKIRRTSSLKLPDSIISASALSGGFVLVTDDQKLADRHIGSSISLDELITSN